MNNPKEWQEAISKLGGQLVDALRPVAAKMGVAAEHLYAVLVRQSIVENLSNLAGWWIVSVFVIYAAYRMRLEIVREKWKCEDDRAGALFLAWALTAAVGKRDDRS